MTDYKSMFEQAVRTLAAIDEALGIGDDGCGDPDQTLTAIAELKAARLLLENDRENTRLRLEVYALQEALNFWLPCVSGMDSKCAERIASDAGLLAGYSGDLEETAEAAGWITLTANA